MDRSRSRPSEVWRTDHPSDRQGGPIPRDRSSLHKQDVFNDFEAYELKLAVSRLSLNLGASYQWKAGGNQWQFYVKGQNLTNRLAYAATSFIKTAAPLTGRNLLVGVRMDF